MNGGTYTYFDGTFLKGAITAIIRQGCVVCTVYNQSVQMRGSGLLKKTAIFSLLKVLGLLKIAMRALYALTSSSIITTIN